MYPFFLLILCTVLFLVNAEEANATKIDSQRGSVTLTTENFEAFIKAPVVFIQYCSSRSGICKITNPEWDAFGELASQMGLNVKIVSTVDCRTRTL
jgi:hypothetical protein